VLLMPEHRATEATVEGCACSPAPRRHRGH
jgi:hypothetical protein